MRHSGQIPEGELLRNPLTIRWADDEHKALVDLAWQQRISASEYVRQMIRSAIVTSIAKVAKQEEQR